MTVLFDAFALTFVSNHAVLPVVADVGGDPAGDPPRINFDNPSYTDLFISVSPIDLNSDITGPTLPPRPPK